MPGLTSHPSGLGRRALAVTMLAAIALCALALIWTSDRTAFADGSGLVIRSTSLVGPRSGSTLAPATRLGGPIVVNRSTCRQDLSGAVMTITILDISYFCPVYSGGQAMLNSGALTLISDPALAEVLADHPGGPGLLWIAGHRTSHGGAFAAVPDLADGALIVVDDGSFSATYRVVGRLHVDIQNDKVIDASGVPSGVATLDAIIRPDHGGTGASRVLLQTCDGDNHRWMIYADLVTG